jgi:hypothetical protein
VYNQKSETDGGSGMNEALAAYLRERITEATQKREEARRERVAAEEKEQLAMKQISAYQGTLEFELMGSEATERCVSSVAHIVGRGGYSRRR